MDINRFTDLELQGTLISSSPKDWTHRLRYWGSDEEPCGGTKLAKDRGRGITNISCLDIGLLLG